jgi:predicted kinase
MTCGLNHTGKTTFGNLLQPQLSPSIVVDNDRCRLFAQEHFADLYEKTKDWQNREGNQMNMKMLFVKHLLELGLGNGVSCIHTACNMYAEQRKKFFELAKKHNAKTCLVYFDIPLEVIHKRMEDAHLHKDERLYGAWFEENLQHMLSNFAYPTSDEADVYFEIKDTPDYQKVIDWLQKYIV